MLAMNPNKMMNPWNSPMKNPGGPDDAGGWVAQPCKSRTLRQISTKSRSGLDERAKIDFTAASNLVLESCA